MRKKTDIVYEILRVLEVKHTHLYLKKRYEEHPHKYNLFGISRILKEYGIENEGYKFDNKEVLNDLDVPFVAQYHDHLVIVLKLTKTHVYYDINGKELSVTIPEFKKEWSGVALLIGEYADAKEPEYKKNLVKEIYSRLLYGIVLLSFFIIPLLHFVSNDRYLDPGMVILFLLNALGTYIGYLLVLKQIKIHSASADKICSIFKKSDCNSVLESKAAKLWGIIGWSEAGLSYFSSNLIILFFFPDLLSYLALINICVLPYSIWSIWYQKVRAKQWCALCLLVQILFYCLFVSNLSFGFIHIPEWNIINLTIVSLVYILPFSLISILLPVIAKSLQVSNLKHEFNKLKMTSEVFNGLLYAKDRYEVGDASKIIFGNPAAKTQITVISNPHCQPCGTVHEKIDKLLNHIEEEDICVRFLFLNFNIEEVKNSGKFLIAVYLNNEPAAAKDIFYKWFIHEKYAIGKTYKKYGFDMEADEVVEEQLKHEKWSKQNNMHQTPTILFNGYKLPEIYDMEDIRLLV